MAYRIGDGNSEFRRRGRRALSRQNESNLFAIALRCCVSLRLDSPLFFLPEEYSVMNRSQADSEIITIHVAVGTENPSKIRSVRAALERVCNRHDSSAASHTLDIQGVSVSSGVPHQPFGDTETKQGALNRAKNAFEAYKKKFGMEPDLSVGLEGGLDYEKDKKGDLWCMAWMAIYGKRSKKVLQFTAASDYLLDETKTNDDDNSDVILLGLAKTAAFALPASITELVMKEGMELGDADDKVFSRINSKHKSGTVGKVTDSLIDRSCYYEHALVLALIPWIRPDVYPHGNQV
jgi:non-canonical (house-cleaning) NTP pyrophosphatase